MQEKIEYHEIMNRGFNEEILSDPNFFKEFGFDYSIITLKLTKKTYLEWEKETQLCEFIRIDSKKKRNIMARTPINNLNQLDSVISFFKD